MATAIDLDFLKEYAASAASEVGKMIAAAKVEAPNFNGEEDSLTATNSLDEKFIAALANGDHLNDDYLEAYYAELAHQA